MADINVALAIAVPLIARAEDFRALPYQDEGGGWTIGYGQTYHDDGSPVTARTPPVTEAEAMAWMRATVAKTMGVVMSLVTVPLTNNQLAALTSLTYNIGSGEKGFRGSSLLVLLNNGLTAAAANQFLVWDHIHNRVDSGLVNRRAREMQLFNTPDEPAPGVIPVIVPPKSNPPSPLFHPVNITLHPGSTFAGLAAAFAAIGTVLGSSAIPTSPVGWTMLAGALLSAVGSALGR